MFFYGKAKDVFDDSKVCFQSVLLWNVYIK
jgi:hypothetical protein